MLTFRKSFFVMRPKNIKKNFLSRWFRPRDLMIREQDDISFCSLSVGQQVGLFLILTAFIAWCAFTSIHFLNYNAAFSRKSEELEQIRSAYADLKGEVQVFADYVDKIIAQMDDEQQAFDRLKQNQSAAPDQPKVRVVDISETADVASDDKNSAEELETNIARLKKEAVFVRDRLTDMIGGREDVKDTLPFYRVQLQRDIAVADVEVLQEKVNDLEKLISGMQEAQILAFRKMAALADDGIGVVENGLSDIKSSLSASGVSMETLLRRIRQNKETVGIGGPFIPSPMPKPRNDLNISLVSLNQRLDRWYDLTTLQNSLPIGKPVDRIRVTSPFGARGDPFQGSPAHHEAVDLGGMIGEPVYATAPGKVVQTGNWGWYGNMVEIDHGLGFRTRYAHMEKVFVTKGETVRAGDRIGTLGNTGRSTGPHLHYEVRIRGIPVDPMKFIKAKKNVFKN